MQKPPLKFLDSRAGPKRLDRYELIAEIATGGMGTVYLARIAGAGGFSRFVAIKRLHSHLAEEQEFVAMFLDEARLAAGIHHPNVVPILDVGESKAGYYLVLEYVEGESLGGLRRDATNRGYDFAPSVLARIAVDALMGLHAAHELRDDLDRPLHIVHRDVSPQNILVGIDGMSRIIDFGIARAARRLSTTRTGEVKGKLAYMAPEQVKRGLVDRRTDVFAAGIVFWEMLTAHRLFRGESDLQTLNRVVVGDIPDVREINRAVPPGFAQAIARALLREANERFPTAHAFADAIVESTPVASVQEVASYTEFLIGEDLRIRRDAVRKWLQPNPNAGDDDEPEIGTQTVMVQKAKRADDWARKPSSLPSVVEPGDLEDQTLTQQMQRGARKDRPAAVAPRIVGLPGSPAPATAHEHFEVPTAPFVNNPLLGLGAGKAGPPRPGAAPPRRPASMPAPAAAAASSAPRPTPPPPPPPLSQREAVPSSAPGSGMARAPALPPAALSNALPQRIPGPLPSPHFDSLSIVPTPHPPDAPPPPRPQPVAVPPVPVPSFGDLSAGEQAALAGRSRMPVGIVVAGVIGVLAFAAFLALMGGWIASNDPPPPAVNGPKK